jgi:hypothetical protein
MSDEIALPLSADDAKRIYWETRASVKEAEALHGLTGGQLAKLAGPIDLGLRCDECGSRMLAHTRSERELHKYWLAHRKDPIMTTVFGEPAGHFCKRCESAARERHRATTTEVERTLLPLLVLNALDQAFELGVDQSDLDESDLEVEQVMLACRLIEALEEAGVCINVALRGVPESTVELARSIRSGISLSETDLSELTAAASLPADGGER